MKKIIIVSIIITFICFIFSNVEALPLFSSSNKLLLPTSISSLNNQAEEGKILPKKYNQNNKLIVTNLSSDLKLSSQKHEDIQIVQSLPEDLTNANLNLLMPPDIQNILQRGELRVAMLGVDNPPFFMEENNSQICDDEHAHIKVEEKNSILCGLDVEIGKAIADELGVKVKFDRSQTKFNDVVNLVFEQKADLAISKLSISLKRAQKMRFSQPYVNMREGLLVNRLQLAQREKNSSTIEAIRNLEGKVGVIQGTQYLLFAKSRFPKATIVEYPSWEEIIQAVVKGEILAGYRDEMEVKKIVLTQPNVALKVKTVALTDTKDSIAVILPWQNHQLLEFVNQLLSTKGLNYSVNDLIDKYPEVF